MMPIMNQQRKKLPGARGFTLVEIMMVILILGIISSVSIPSLFRYVSAHRLQTNTDRMATDMQYARSVAVSHAQIINFSSTSTGYTLSDAITGSVLRQVAFDNGLVMDTTQSVMFYPWGMADDAVFTLSSSIGAYDISLLPTGMVEVTIQ